MSLIHPVFGDAVLPALQHFVALTKLHPILVNFTSALVPVSLASDLAGKVWKSESLRSTGWWTLVFATVVTPLTAIAGWLFWMPDDNGVPGMAIHKWLGTALAVLLFGLFAWRLWLKRKNEQVTIPYLFVGGIFLAALGYQGFLGGQQVFSGM